MSGHSKWSQIKHRKAITDKKKSQIFSKLTKLISIAAKEGTDPNTNYKLKSAVEKAKSLNMPSENIKRAISKIKDAPQVALEELTIEAVGPVNISIIIEAITDNKNRTLAEIKKLLSKNEAKIATPGSQLWQFKRMGIIKLSIPSSDKRKRNLIQEDLELQLIEAGAEEIKKEDSVLEIYTKPENVEIVKTTLNNMELDIESSGLEYIPKMPLKIEGSATKIKLNNLFEILDEYDDVEEIYSNVEF